jgi:hypothetical protein
MYPSRSFQRVRSVILLAFTTTILAQSSSCAGDTSSYPLNGLIIPFKNLCGKDISAAVDFLDPTWETSFGDCMRKCVEKKPLCYGFDYNLGPMQANCWLMNASFPESATTEALNPRVDAAMLSSEILSGLSEDCKSLGLKGCWSKNGALAAASSTARTSTSTSTLRVVAAATTGLVTSSSGVTTTTAPSTTPGTGTPPPVPSNGLSTGAKAGIGAGVGAAALLFIGLAVIVLLKRRRKKSMQEDITQVNHVPEKKPMAEYHPHPHPHPHPYSGTAELPVQHGLCADAELEGTSASPTAARLHGTYGYGELSSSTGVPSNVQRQELDGGSHHYGR